MRNTALKRLTALSVISLFSFWLIPLGSFIKPSQEKTACGGQRAVCCCSVMKSELNGKTMEPPAIQGSANNLKETNSPGGNAGHYYLATDPHALESLLMGTFELSMKFYYQSPLLGSIEHVPKA